MYMIFHNVPIQVGTNISWYQGSSYLIGLFFDISTYHIVYNLGCNPYSDPTLDCPKEGGENHKQVRRG